MQTFEKAPGRPLFEQVREHLRQLCQSQPADVALPSLRQMSESLNVNHITITRALRALEAEGVVNIIPGKGTFVCAPRNGSGNIEMVTILANNSFLRETSRHTFRGLQERVPDGGQLTGTTLMLPPLPDINGFIQSLKARQIAAVAFFGFGYLPHPEAFHETELIHRVAQEMPVVLISKEHNLLKLDCVYCDPGPQLQTYLEECYANGLRRFQYLGAGERLSHLERRQNVFEDFLLAHGLAWQRPIAADAANNETLVNLALDAGPEVVVASTAARAYGLVFEAQRRGLVLGRDLHVICFAGSPEEVESIANSVDIILLEEEEVGRCVGHLLGSRLQGTDKPAPVVRRVPGRFVRRGQLQFS